MLPKKHRFTARKEIRQVFHHGFRKQSHSFVMVSWQPTERINLPWRATIIVSKKVAPLATQRNKIRRVISELIWKTKDVIIPATDIALLVRKSIDTNNSSSLQNELLRLLGG